MSTASSGKTGFTLIELSIVLVIIGLIVGGVLVGRDLIRSAYVRAQVTQIEKYNTAANTFYGKYQALPGDMNASVAQANGFSARAGTAGQGDGNGLIEGINGNSQTDGWADAGEAKMFWNDLAHVGLVPGNFTACLADVEINDTTTPTLASCLPQAAIGQGNYVYLYSGGVIGGNGNPGDGKNYFGLGAVIDLESTAGGGWYLASPSITVNQAYNIDRKVDDGFPQSGRVIAAGAGESISWAAGGGWVVAIGNVTFNYQGDYDTTTKGAITPLTTAPSYATDNGATINQTCYNNGHTLAPEQYSVNINGGAGLNCEISFQLQAGD
jgi:prepilin-type N-terminal cleavage/methylation domain-containing protein